MSLIGRTLSPAFQGRRYHVPCCLCDRGRVKPVHTVLQFAVGAFCFFPADVHFVHSNRREAWPRIFARAYIRTIRRWESSRFHRHHHRLRARVRLIIFLPLSGGGQIWGDLLGEGEFGGTDEMRCSRSPLWSDGLVFVILCQD